MKYYILTILIICFSLPSITSQNLQTVFGKNRIQYHDDFETWWLYETDNFVSHWYGKSRYIGQTVMQMAEYDYYEIQNILEHRINDKIDIIVFTDESDVKQSNIGDEDAYISTSGKTKVSGNKIFVYYDGNHINLRKQLREGIAHVYLNAILFGSNLQELVQNTVNLKIPEWFKEGLISYIGEDWSIELDETLRYTFNQKKFKRFGKIADYYPEEIGHAFWDYIGKTYGKSTIANLLYLTRINKNPKKAFLFVLGVPYKQITEECYDYFKSKYSEEIQLFEPIALENHVIKTKRGHKITGVQFSPDQRYLTFIENDIGKAKVKLHDIEKGSNRTIMVTGYRNNIQSTDENYPIIAWHHTQPKLIVIFEEKDIIKSKLFDFTTNEITEDLFAPEYQRVFSADFISSNELIISASTEGYADLYQYSLRNRQSSRITEDFFDDHDVKYVQSSKHNGILFASNRITTQLDVGSVDTILPIDQYDIYFLDLTTDSFVINQLTETYHANERHPDYINPEMISYMTDETGVWNQAEYTLEDKSQNFLSNYSHNAITHHIQPPSSAVSYRVDNKDYIFIKNQSSSYETPSITQYHKAKYPFLIRNDWNTIEQEAEEKIKQISEDTIVYLFQSEFDDPEESVFDQLDIKDEIIDDYTTEPKPGGPMDFRPLEKFEFPKMLASRLKFKFDRFFSNLDNSILFDGLDTYAGTKRGFEFPPMGILLKASVNDLFEDYEFEGGVRIPTSFNGSEYFLIFDDKKRRIDKRYALYRRSTLDDETEFNTSRRIHNISFIGLSQWRYPFDVYSSLRLQGTLRLDKRILLASDVNTLNSVDVDEQRIGLKLEYVFDNTVNVDLNIMNGSRYKVYIEAVKKMNVQLFDPWKFSFDDGFMTVIGLDARHYQKLDRNSILATRLSGATSFGSEQIVYFMGGMNNWLFPQYNEQIPIPPSETYAYNALAANMRGFKQNIRNGTSFLLLNAELRVPVFKYFFQRDLNSSFLRNFMITSFFDIGTAWHGKNPYDPDNPLNIISVSNPLVSIDINYSREPIVYGYGLGARVYLLGYLIKADYAWGVESGLRLNPRFYISLGTDF